MSPKLSYIIEQDEPGRARDCMNAGELPGILVTSDSGWEFRVEPFQAGGHGAWLTRWATKIVIFSDAYPAFTEIPGFFSALAGAQYADLHGVQAALDAMGASDATRRAQAPGGPAAAGGGAPDARH